MNKIWWKNIHNVLGIASATFLIILLVTGILLNHPSWVEDNPVRIVSKDATHPHRLLQARKEGLYYSWDQGKTWEEFNMLFPPREAVDISYSFSDKDHIYVLEKWGKIVFSKTKGKTWGTIQLPFDPQNKGVELEKLSVQSPQELLLYTSHGFMTSIDGGQSWDETHLDKDSQPLRRLILTLHNGYFFGPFFVWVYDFSAIALLILIISGLVLWKIGRKVA